MPRPKSPAVETLEHALKRRVREADLAETLEGGRVRCVACGHRCVILEGLDGICRVRFNQAGVLYAPHGYVAGMAVDPIEKKPFFHVLPGESALSFGMLGCDYHCRFCQNWLTSQVLRDSEALEGPQDITAVEILDAAIARRSPVMVSTYNEPLITSEWAVDVFRLAKPAGILCGYVSNGNATPEVLRYLRPYVDLYKVDLKSFRDASYREMGGKLDHVLDTIRDLHRMGFWVEIVTLLIPAYNDSKEELRELTSFIASVSPDIPWHVTAFHQDYKMTGPAATTPSDLARAADTGQEAGLRFVYAGNLPGRVGPLENTFCPGCSAPLVERSGYRISSYRITAEGRCPSCSREIPGVWRAATVASGTGHSHGSGTSGRLPPPVRIPAVPSPH